MKRFKQLVGALLAVMLLVCAVPLGGLTATAATTLTEEQFAEKLAAVKKEYPDGKYWNEYNGTTTVGGTKVAKAGNKICSGTSGGATCKKNGYCAKYGSCTCSCGYFHGWQCHGFANLVAYKVFGSYATNWINASSNSDVNKNWEYHKSVSQYYAGDFIRLTNGYHSMFVTKVTSTRVYVVDCNRAGPCEIDWDYSYKISDLQKKPQFVVRYKNNTLTGSGSTTHKLTIQYNANGGQLADNLYVVHTDGDVGLWMRASYSTSAKQLVLVPEDTRLTVSETKTSGGYTWGKTTYNGQTGWCAISVGAVKLYYLNSDTVYTTVSKKAYAHSWDYGTGDSKYGLTNAGTFGLSKTGYEFVGWSLSANGSTTVFDEDDGSLKAEDIYPNVKNGDATVTLYAVWSPLAKVVTKLEIASLPDKTVYYIGDSLDVNGLMLKRTYNDGSTDTTTPQGVSEFDSTTAGTKTLLTGWGDMFVPFEVTVKEPTITLPATLALEKDADKAFAATTDPAGQKVTYTTTDSEVATVENGKIFAKANGKATVTAEMTVNNIVYTAQCVVTVGDGVKVTPRVVQSIEVEQLPKKTVYTVGESLDTAELKVKVTYTDGSSEILSEGFTVSGFDSASAGTKTVTVIYDGKTASYAVSVNTAQTVTDPTAPQIVLETKRVTTGSRFTVKAEVKNNPGFNTASVKIVYDTAKLKLVGAELGESYAAGSSVSYDNLPYITFIRSDDIAADSVFLTLTFEALKPGESTVSVSYADGDISNFAEDDVDFAVVDGKITVSDYMAGDLNNDGKVNTKDLTRLLKYINHETVDCNELALDVNGDGKVNTKDLTRLLRYINRENVEIY